MKIAFDRSAEWFAFVHINVKFCVCNEPAACDSPLNLLPMGVSFAAKSTNWELKNDNIPKYHFKFIQTLGTAYQYYATHACKVTAKSIKPFSRKVEIRKQAPQQQQQSRASSRAATKVAAKKYLL